jgi:hypothetical protein
MSDRIYVGTRKGLFIIERKGKGKGWAIGSTSFLGAPVTMVLPDPRDGALYAALNHGHFGVKVHRSEDGGKKWEEVAAPQFPGEAEKKAAQAGDDPDARRPKPDALYMIWALETGGAEEPGLLYAGTLPGAVFTSRDRGASWKLNEALWDRPERPKWFGGGYELSGVHSICLDPRDDRHVTVGISCGGCWETRDGGATWEVVGKGLRADYMPPDLAMDPNIQDPHRLQRSAGAPDAFWVQHHNGVFRSTDGAATFEEISERAKPAAFGFAVAAHPSDAETAWFVPGVKDEQRLPVDGKLVVSRTQDGGKTFEVLREGLPQKHAYDIVFRHGLDVDAKGKRLAFGSTTGGLWTSKDGGESWKNVSMNLPPVNVVRFGA